MAVYTKAIPDIVKLYDSYSAASLSMVETRRVILNGIIPSTFSDFRYLTAEEVRQRFDFILTEIELGFIFLMMSAVEGAIRDDFELKRSKKALFRVLKSVFGSRIRFKDILNRWVDSHPSLNKTVEKYKGALNLRHWIAHGRYWDANVGQATKYSADDIFTIGSALLAEIQSH